MKGVKYWIESEECQKQKAFSGFLVSQKLTISSTIPTTLLSKCNQQSRVGLMWDMDKPLLT